MATPLRDGSPTPTYHPTTANFEYDDNEWDIGYIGIGDLIIDLDADIEKTGVGEGMAAPKPGKMHSSVEHQATVDKGLKMKIKRTKPGTKHEIVKSGENGEKKRGSSGHKKKHGEKAGLSKDVNGVGCGLVERGVALPGPAAPPPAPPPLPPKQPPPTDSPPPPPLKKLKPQPNISGGGGSSKFNGCSSNSNSSTSSNISISNTCNSNSNSSCNSSSNSSCNSSSSSGPASAVSPAPPPLTPQLPQPPDLPFTPLPLSTSPPPPTIPLAKQDVVDVCVGTSVGTITEPDCLGPCEPGTSVTLEGIVWHETEGVLVVNVTWRGKTYVGTLLDCTKHDWAPPRFCDSPTTDLDLRTPKGRGKRGRNSANSLLSDLANFTETRSSVHSKLRSNNAVGGSKGRRGPTAASPTSFATPKVEPTTSKRKAKSQEEEGGGAGPGQPQPASKRKALTGAQPLSLLPPPPVLLECPEPNCCKKYKNINGLKYHQSHAHGAPDDEETKESLTSEEEEPPVTLDIKKEEPNETSAPPIDENPESLEKPSEESSFSCEEVRESPRVVVIQDGASSTPSPPAIEASMNLSASQEPSSLRKAPPLKVKPPSALIEESQFSLPSSSSPTEEVCVVRVSQSEQEVETPEGHESAESPQPVQMQQQPLLTLQPQSQPTPSQLPHQQQPSPLHQTQSSKRKPKKSPNSSPHPSPLDPPSLGLETVGGREGVQSPAYSDISDDAAPLLESEVEGKPKTTDDKKGCQSPTFGELVGIYNTTSYYPQPPYLVPSVPEKAKDNPCDKLDGNVSEKEKKDDHQQKLLPQHYYQYGFHVPVYPFNNDEYPVVLDDKKDEKIGQTSESKQVATSTLHIPNPTKLKVSETPVPKEKHQNENHLIIKESIEVKNQLNSTYMYPRPAQGPEDVRRFFIYPDRKEGTSTKLTPPPSKSHPVPSPKPKDKLDEKRDRPEEKKQQEGVKPTMETQGPPPPPTSQYTYIHPGYMQSPHYTTLPLEPPGLYRGTQVLLSGYPNYLHPQLHTVPRYAPEDLSRGQNAKSLDLLQHHANQYYGHPSHKIHELQERALKSPIPKVTTALSSPSSSSSTPALAVSSSMGPGQGKASSTELKDSRSPPPQRHVHTHHHTHVGLGYPILTGQYPAPYGAAVLATEHAAAITSVPYQTK